jgi:predicted nucleotidyltransferase
MKIDFEFTTQYGVFRDALYLSDDHALGDDEINALKQERLDNWLNAIENPAPRLENGETVEIDGVVYEKIELDGQLVLKPVQV